MSRAIEIAENGFDILKSRYRILETPIQVKENTDKDRLCACTLHNWLCITVSRIYTSLGTTDYEDHEFTCQCGGQKLMNYEVSVARGSI